MVQIGARLLYQVNMVQKGAPYIQVNRAQKGAPICRYNRRTKGCAYYTGIIGAQKGAPIVPG